MYGSLSESNGRSIYGSVIPGDIAPSMAACVLVHVGGLCECVCWEDGNVKVLESAGLEILTTFLIRVKFGFLFFFFLLESLSSENISVTSCNIKNIYRTEIFLTARYKYKIKSEVT